MRTTTSRYTLLVGVVLLASALTAGCSGGGSSSMNSGVPSPNSSANPGTAAPSQQTAKAALTVSIPDNGQLESTDRRATKSIYTSGSIVVRYAMDANPANAPTNAFDFPASTAIAAGAPANVATGTGGNCSTVGGSLNCTLSVTLPVGVLDLYLLVFDGQNGNGALMYGSVTTLRFNSNGTFSAATASGPSSLSSLQANPVCGVPTPTPSASPSSTSLLYVPLGTLQSSQANPRVEAYPLNTNGNVGPTKTILENANNLTTPTAIAFDTNGNLYVANNSWPGDATSTDFISVYPPGATGSAVPSRQIGSIQNSTLGSGVIEGLAVDAAGFVYVAEIADCPSQTCSDSIFVMPPNASGNVAPVRTISSSACNQIGGLAVTPSGALVVACVPFSTSEPYSTGRRTTQSQAAYPGEIETFAPGAAGNATPVSTISGNNTLLTGAGPIALTTQGTIVIYPRFGPPGSILTFPQSANGNVAPTQAITGSSTQLVGGGGVAVDAAGNIYAVNPPTNGSSFGSIVEFAANASGNMAPIKELSGSNVDLDIVWWSAAIGAE